MKTRMFWSSAFVSSLLYLVVHRALADTRFEAIRPVLIDNSLMRNYLRHFHDSQIYMPRLQINEILAKRAVVPYNGGIYGKRSIIYDKRSQDSPLNNLLNDQMSVEIRAMPMNGGFFG